MQAHVVIDDILIAQAMEATGSETEQQVIELGLRMLVSLRKQADIRSSRGTLAWAGDLDALRRDE